MAFGNDPNKKRLVIIGISTFMLVALVGVVTVGVGLKNNESSSQQKDDNNNNKKEISASLKAIKSLCQATDYKRECVDKLGRAAGNTTDPKKLIQIAFTVAQKYIAEANNKSQVLKTLEQDPRTSKALYQCRLMMNQAMGELKHAFDKLGDFDANEIQTLIMDLKVWLSATITYQETCLDGFNGTTGDAAQKMKAALKMGMHLSSNALAMISEVAPYIAELHSVGLGTSGRRLLEEDMVVGHGLDMFSHDFGRKLRSNSPFDLKPNVVVAKDGTGDCKTIKDALKRVPKKSKKPFVIYVKEGIYKEYVTVEKDMTHVVMIGDGGNKTRITGHKNFKDGLTTMLTATVSILGDHFMARNMGFENSAGAAKHQAVALRVDADEVIFYRCQMDGYQDTLYTHAKRQFYRDCTVSGTIDFIFGDAAALFQNCKFVVRKPEKNQQCIVTAQGRKERHQPSGIIFQNCSIVADPEYYPVRFENKAYLARPWKEYSRTIFMDSFIDDLIQPQGFLPWDKEFALNTCFYSEFNNRGPGSNKTQRATWGGIKNITQQEAIDFTSRKFFTNDSWIKHTRVPYFPDMSSTLVQKKE